LFRTVVLVSILAGFLFGGKFTRLRGVQLKNVGWLFASFALKLCAVLLSGRIPPSTSLCSVLSILTYGMLFYGLYPNLKIPGFSLLAGGSLLNFLAIIFNQGRMPVATSLLDPVLCAKEIQGLGASLVHQPLSENVNLKPLTDIFGWTFFSKVPTTFSIGDVLIAIGISWFILYAMLRGFSAVPKGDRIS